MFIGLPIIFVWIIGFPITIFLALYKRRKDLDNQDTERMFGLFFVGLNNDSYYWEIIIVNLRKTVFILCSTLLSSINSQLKVIFLYNILGTYCNHSSPYSISTHSL